MADDENPGPALPVLNATVLSSTEHLAIVWAVMFFPASSYEFAGVGLRRSG